jgi:hypothetical protein
VFAVQRSIITEKNRSTIGEACSPDWRKGHAW